MRRLVIGLFFLVGGCTFDPLAGAQLMGPNTVQDASITEDAAISIDAGEVADAGVLLDSGPQLDGTVPDATADASIPDATPDAGPPSDAGTPDTGIHGDASLPDTGGLPDAGMPDMGMPDTGGPLDTGMQDTGVLRDTGVDAGMPDTGVMPDAGMPDTGVVPDAGMPDTGVVLDTGIVPDAGTPDTGVGVDAGPLAVCTDGQIEGAKTCDDGNMISTDGCSGCQVTLGWRCLFEPSRCVRLVNVSEVDGTAMNCNGGNSANGNPWCELGNALDQNPVPALILVADDVYQEDLLIDGLITVIIHAANGATIVSDDGKAITAKSGANVTISGITIQGDGSSGNGGVKVENSGSFLTLLNSHIGPSDTRGLELKSDARLYMSGNVVADNEGGGLYLDSNNGYTVWNNIIKDNGDSGSDFGGVRIKKTSATARFINNTVAGNFASGRPAGVRCDVTQDLINVIVWGNMGNSASGLSTRCVPRYSSLQGTVAGLGNISTSPLLVGPLLTLDVGSPARNAGHPFGVIPGGPAPFRDFSGNRRPLILNVDMGAHESP